LTEATRHIATEGRVCNEIKFSQYHLSMGTMTYIGQPKTIAMTARTVQPTPYPSFPNIAGAKSGKAKPAMERRNVTEAKAEAACKVNASMMYVVIGWKLRSVPAATNANPCET
jgi:hypothetical protein